MVAEFDANKDGLLSENEFKTLYESHDCSNEGPKKMFDRLNVNENTVLDGSEIKEMWIYFAGKKCENFA